MLNSPFSNEKIIKNISQTNNIKDLKTLFQGISAIDLSVHFETNLPISLCWDAKSDTFTGHQSITIYPKLVINGELYEAPFKHDLVLPMDGFLGLEAAFLKTLKEAISSVQKVLG